MIPLTILGMKYASEKMGILMQKPKTEISKQRISVVDLDKVALVADNLAKAVDQEVDKADKNSKEP